MEADFRPLAVGLGEVKVARHSTRDGDQKEVLVAYGLGSCVAICLLDPARGVAGMAHVVLPGADPMGKPNGKFARSALPALIARMREKGATGDPRRWLARLAGGAQVLALGGTGTLPRVGEQNGAAVQEVLLTAGIPLLGVDLGGGRGRTVWFDPQDGGRIRVRAVGSSERYL